MAAEGSVQPVTGTDLRESDGMEVSYRWTLKNKHPKLVFNKLLLFEDIGETPEANSTLSFYRLLAVPFSRPPSFFLAP